MKPIDLFINQLIQLGLADSFLDVINEHYIKVTTIYNIINEVDENNINNIELIETPEIDSISIILHINNPIDIDLLTEDVDKDISVQVINNGDNIELTVTNKYESEGELYETRFNGCRTTYTHKWS